MSFMSCEFYKADIIQRTFIFHIFYYMKLCFYLCMFLLAPDHEKKRAPAVTDNRYKQPAASKNS